MSRKLTISIRILGLAVIASLAAQAHANIITETANWNYSAFAGSGSLNIAVANAAGGATYINSFGNPNVPGTEFRSLGMAVITNLTSSAGNTNNTATNNLTNYALLVFALDGTTQANGVQQFNSGTYAIVNLPTGSAPPLNDPTQWGLGTSSFSSANIVNYGAITPPDSVAQGPNGAANLALLPSQVNQVSGTLLDQSVFGGNAIATMKYNGGAGPNLFTNLAPNGITPPPAAVVFGNITEKIEDTANGAQSQYAVLSSSLGQANNIAAGLFALAGVANSQTFGFSSNSTYSGSSGGFDGTAYNPNNGLAGGDFATGLNTNVTAPGVFVPEPASVMVWGLVFAAGAALSFRKARKKQVA